MDKEKDSGIMEVVAIAALLFLFWKFYIKKKKIIKPATTPAELKDPFARDPDFNLNDYCKDVIYRPLASTDLTLSNLLGEGWCYRGDRSAIDESKGFGDAYADKQADDYQTMKNEEAVFINSKSYVQFSLINSTASPITTDVLNTAEDSTPVFDPIPDAVTASAGTGVTSSGFTASWAISGGATGYYIDVATDIGFTSYVSGYQNLDIGNVLSYAISGLSQNTNYYYRIRAYNSSGTSEDSNIITVTTETLYDDYYLPSFDELAEIRTALYLFGVGDITEGQYWSSSEADINFAKVLTMLDGSNVNYNKQILNSLKIRAIRTFVSSIVYSVRDLGQAGGYIFYLTDNGDGTYTYLEAAPANIGDANTKWSNVATLVGTSDAIGDGQANTNAILAQPGFTGGAAKTCDDLEIDG